MGQVKPEGVFITFEGGEGVGKTTQINLLAEHLKSKGHDVVVTREPGGCPAAEDLRNLIFAEKYEGQWSAEAETLMMFAARDTHIKQVIAPALAENKVVICDRYIDSTVVYQGIVKGVNLDLIKGLEQEIMGEYQPQRTYVFDLPAAAAMERVQGRGAENHHDRAGVEFYEALQKGFVRIAEENAERCMIVDAAQSVENISAVIQQDLEKILA